MFFCKKCGNDIKSLYTQIHKQHRRYGITGCPRWLYYITCDCCKKAYNYRNLIEHKILFTTVIISLIHI